MQRLGILPSALMIVGVLSGGGPAGAASIISTLPLCLRTMTARRRTSVAR